MSLVGSGRFPAIVPSNPSSSGGRVARAVAGGIGVEDLNGIPQAFGGIVRYIDGVKRNSKPALPAVGENSSPAPVPAGNAEEKKEEEKPPLR